MAKEFDTNLLRLIAAQLYILNQRETAKDMFDRPYHLLSPEERTAIDTALYTKTAGTYQWLTPERLSSEGQQPAGFGIPKAQQSSESSS